MIQGNVIGLDAAGGVLGNGYSGITVAGHNVAIGGSSLGAGNVLSGNGAYGISVLPVIVGDPDPTSTVILGNKIGTDGTGNLPRGNLAAGISLVGVGHVIGGTFINDANVIRFNGGGVRVTGATSTVQIALNAINQNTGLEHRSECGRRDRERCQAMAMAGPNLLAELSGDHLRDQCRRAHPRGRLS